MPVFLTLPQLNLSKWCEIANVLSCSVHYAINYDGGQSYVLIVKDVMLLCLFPLPKSLILMDV